MALSTPSVSSTTSVITRTQVQPEQVPVRQPQPEVKTTAQKEQESPTPALSNDLGQPNIDGTGASFSILA